MLFRRDRPCERPPVKAENRLAFLANEFLGTSRGRDCDRLWFKAPSSGVGAQPHGRWQVDELQLELGVGREAELRQTGSCASKRSLQEGRSPIYLPVYRAEATGRN